jgi:hypothetical protein
MSKTKKDDLLCECDDDVLVHLEYILKRVFNTPSMIDKMPKHIMKRVDMIYEYSEKSDWKWVRDGK